MSSAAFEDLGVLPEIIKAVDEQGWTLPTSVQAESIPLILGGGDVMAAAETGTGKTGAFALPAVQLVWEELRAASKERREADDPSTSATGTAGKGVRLSMEDCDPGLTVDAATGLAASTCAPGFWAGCRATAGAAGGRRCFEVRVERVADAGVVRVGWSGAAAKLDLGADALGFGYGSVGKKAHARQYDTYGEPFGAGDVVLCCLDAAAGAVSFAKNGADLGRAFAPKASVCAAGLFPAVCLKNAAVSLNFGAAPPAYPLPSGYSMLAALAAPPGGGGDGDVIPAPSLASRARRGGSSGSAFDNEGSGPLCLVLEPSRELAEQTHKTFLMLSKYIQRPALRFSLMHGGGAGGNGHQAMGGVPLPMRRGRGDDPHIVTGTPGRLEGLVKEGMLSLSNLRLLILDEADNLAENAPDAILRFYKAAPKARLQVLMFSATLHSDKVRALSEKVCCFPTWVDLKGADFIPYTVDHAFYVVNPRDDAKLLRASPVRIDTDKVHLRTDTSEDRASEFIKMTKPHVLLRVIAAHEMNQAIIFCRTKLDCDNLEAFLERSLACDRRAFPAGDAGSEKPPQLVSLSVVLHSDKTQEERARNLERFKKGLARFLITTDVAARGIDVGEVPYVINYTLPNNVEDYIHRAGRVGRAETMGLAISLVGGAKERVWFHRCPTRGKGCTNRQLVSDGGCTLWYDEKALWSAISLKISSAQGSLVRMTAAGGYRVPGDLGIYGRRAVGKGKASAHAAALKSKAEQVAELDGTAQVGYWNLYRFKRQK